MYSRLSEDEPSD